MLNYTLAPANEPQLTVCYLFWVGLFMSINVCWDIFSTKTPPFHIAMMQTKRSVLHQAAAFCSCVLVIAALVDHSIHELSDETVVPLLLASLSGMFQALPALCPYKLKAGQLQEAED